MSNQREPTEFYDPKTIDITDRTDLAEDEYYVEKVVKKRIGKNYQTEYQVKWVDYPSSANTWEAIENMTASTELIKEFEEERLKNAGTNRAKKVPTTENLSKSMIEDQIKALIESPDDIHSVVGFIPFANRFLSHFKTGHLVDMPTTYLNRLTPDRRKIFIDCLANLREEYVKYNKLKADAIGMTSQLKKIQATKNTIKEKKKSKTESGSGSFEKRIAKTYKWLNEETDDEEMSDEETNQKVEEEEDEDDEEAKKKKRFKEKCLKMYMKNVSLNQKNACKKFLLKHYDEEDNSSDSEGSDDENDDDSLKDFEEDDELEEGENYFEIIEPENIPEVYEMSDDENEGVIEEEFDEEEEDENERNFKREEEKKEKDEIAGFLAGATAAAEAIAADVDSDDEVIFPQEALFPVVRPMRAISCENFAKPSSESTIVPMEVDDSSKRNKSPSPDYLPFDMGPSTSTGSKGIGLPSYTNFKRITTFSDDSDDSD